MSTLKTRVRPRELNYVACRIISSAVSAFEARSKLLARRENAQDPPPLSCQQVIDHFAGGATVDMPSVLDYLANVGLVRQSNYPDLGDLPASVHRLICGKRRYKIDRFRCIPETEREVIMCELTNNGPVCFSLPPDIRSLGGEHRISFGANVILEVFIPEVSLERAVEGVVEY